MKRVPPVKKNDTLSLDITTLNSEGQGVGRVEGYALFVPGALPRERVQVSIIKTGANYGVARLLSIETPAEARVFPPCPGFGRCGGCALQHMEYQAQLSYKRQVVESALSRIGGFADVEVAPPIGMERPWEYRNKGGFPLANVAGKVEAGFYANHSHKLVLTPYCLIQRKPVLDAVQAVCDWANACGLSAYDEVVGRGLLRHVVARVTSLGETMVTLVAAAKPAQTDLLVKLLRERVEGLCSVYLNINAQTTNVILGRTFKHIWGKARITEQICGITFTLGPASFLQVNHEQTEALYAKALELLALNGSERVVDAYCGMGSITLLLAQHAKEVLGIESVPQAVHDAEQNAEQNGMGNASFICGAAEEVLPILAEEGYCPDALVMDPPRKGAEEAFLQAILQSKIAKVLYISCNPGTLARDCKILAEGGYAIKAVQPVDMFPHAGHVETAVLLLRK